MVELPPRAPCVVGPPRSDAPPSHRLYCSQMRCGAVPIFAGEDLQREDLVCADQAVLAWRDWRGSTLAYVLFVVVKLFDIYLVRPVRGREGEGEGGGGGVGAPHRRDLEGDHSRQLAPRGREDDTALLGAARMCVVREVDVRHDGVRWGSTLGRRGGEGVVAGIWGCSWPGGSSLSTRTGRRRERLFVGSDARPKRQSQSGVTIREEVGWGVV